MTSGIGGCGDPTCQQIILNAIEARTLTIPATNLWSLVALAFALSLAGAVVIRRHTSRKECRPFCDKGFPLALSLLLTASAARAQVNALQSGQITYLRLGDGDPFRSTASTVSGLRSVAIPDSAGLVALWMETDSAGAALPFYAVSFSGTTVDTVTSTSYNLELRYTTFDPAIEQPAVAGALQNDDESELYIVQFVTQPLPPFREAVGAHGCTIYDFLPNHAYVIRVPASSRAAVEALAFVRALVPYHSAYRLEPLILDPPGVGPHTTNIRVWQPGQKGAVAARVATIGGIVNSPDSGKRLFVATLTADQLLEVAGWDEVSFLDPWGPIEPDMNNVREVGGANDLEDVAGYLGSGVRGEVFDQVSPLAH